MADENRLTKYGHHTMGEIVWLVFIILIAPKFNNCNADGLESHLFNRERAGRLIEMTKGNN